MSQDRTAGDLIFETITAMGQEEQEHCIHCNEKWYSIHYRDGVCHSCQQKNLPGRTELARRSRHIRIMYGLGIAALLFLIGRAIFG
ncbi:hypothetical protein HOB10_04410 [Candidatus Parcubacteria bacterium]|jgi:hypothetical protein|nr:hypothetical protein [Candidatus Parcubacteria bacterium]